MSGLPISKNKPNAYLCTIANRVTHSYDLKSMQSFICSCHVSTVLSTLWAFQKMMGPLQWRHNEHDGVSNHQPRDCLLNRLFSADQRKHHSSASLAFWRGIHRWPVNSPHRGPVTRKRFPFDDVIMLKGSSSLMSCGSQIQSTRLALMFYYGSISFLTIESTSPANGLHCERRGLDKTYLNLIIELS